MILPNVAPAQSSLQVLSQIYRQTILGYFHPGRRHAYEKTGLDLQLIANHPVFQFETEFFPSLFLHFQIDPVAATQASENTIALHFIKKAETSPPLTPKSYQSELYFAASNSFKKPSELKKIINEPTPNEHKPMVQNKFCVIAI